MVISNDVADFFLQGTTGSVPIVAHKMDNMLDQSCKLLVLWLHLDDLLINRYSHEMLRF